MFCYGGAVRATCQSFNFGDGFLSHPSGSTLTPTSLFKLLILLQAFMLKIFLLYFFFFLINLFVLFIYFWLHCVFVVAHGLSLVAVSWDYSSLRCSRFSLRWLLLLRSTGSRFMGFSSCGSRALEHRLSSCGAQAELLRSMWDLPGPGLKPASPALAGGFLTTVPLGKPSCSIFILHSTSSLRKLPP